MNSKLTSNTGIWTNETAQLHHVSSMPLAKWIADYLYLSKNTSVYDFGCGIGFYLDVLKNQGFSKIQGFEGKIPEPRVFDGSIIEQNLTHFFDIDEPGNIICLEVGEHIPPEFEDILLNNISRACKGKLILSWAVRGQDGIGHVNCLDNQEVIEKFELLGFKFLEEDTRQVKNIDLSDTWWFKNTLLIFERESITIDKIINDKPLINNFFDAIYCINLDERDDKWSECLRIFKSHNIDVKRVSAIDGRSIEDIPVNEEHRRLRVLMPGETGCLMSHLQVLKEIINNKEENALILEDDVIFTENLGSILESFSHEPESNEYDMLYLGGNHNYGGLENIKPSLARCKCTLTTHAYAVRKSFVEKILPEIEWETVVRQRPIDVIYARHHPFIKAYAITPVVAWQRPTVNDIHQTFTDYSFIKP